MSASDTKMVMAFDPSANRIVALVNRVSVDLKSNRNDRSHVATIRLRLVINVLDIRAVNELELRFQFCRRSDARSRIDSKVHKHSLASPLVAGSNILLLIYSIDKYF